MGCLEEPDCVRHCNTCPCLQDPICSLWANTGDFIRREAIFHDLILRAYVRNNRSCILCVGIVDAFVSAFNLHRQRQNIDVCFRDLVHRRINVMTALCPAWPTRSQFLSIRYQAHLLRPWKFRLLKLKAKFRELTITTSLEGQQLRRDHWLCRCSQTCAAKEHHPCRFALTRLQTGCVNTGAAYFKHVRSASRVTTSTQCCPLCNLPLAI